GRGPNSCIPRRAAEAWNEGRETRKWLDCSNRLTLDLRVWPDDDSMRRVLFIAVLYFGSSLFAAQKKPSSVDGLLDRAASETAARNYRAARADFERAVHLAPRNVEARKGLAYVLTVQGDLPRAIEQLEVAAKLEPNSAETHLMLGQVFER